jgi:hypothetical protein
MAHWVEREARRANRNLLITNLVFLVGAILVFALNTDIDYRSDYIPIAIGVGILLLAGWNCIKAMRRYSEIQTTPVWKHAAVYGNVEQLASQIEQDQQMGKTKYGKLVLTPSWLIRKSFFSTWVSPVNDLAWVHKKVTKHYTNFIPTGKSYAAVIVGRHRQRIEVQMSQKKTDQLLADLAARAPWAIFGYSKDIETAWQKDPAGFVAAVDSRREQVTSKPGAGGGLK